MARFELVSVEPLTLARTNRLTSMYVLSPFVWHDGEQFRMLVRAVPRRDDDPRLKMAEIYHGVSADGLHFEMDVAPAIFPGPDKPDLDGCEDPTVLSARGGLRIWYTGYNEAEQTGRLMLARGADVVNLEKRGVALDTTKLFANPKEPTVVPDGKGWRMFFEYSRDEASLIGEVGADSLDGPWTGRKQSAIKPREDAWDCWHLSPGPVIGEGGDTPAMFYNGATRDAKWRIGWVVFDKGLGKIVERCTDPLLTPEGGRKDHGSDIAFAASAMEHDGLIRIYFSESDQDIRCATVRRG